MARYRPVIFIGPPNAPSDAQELVVGTWSVGLRKARLRGLHLYFNTYEDRYHFKHPEDPRRQGNEGPLPATVVSVFQGDEDQHATTFDQGKEVTGVVA